MIETRQRIIDIIRKNGPVSITTISQITGLTKPNIHHHIIILKKMNCINILPANRPTLSTKGRPENIIHLLPESCPNNLANLASQLLSVFSATAKDEGYRNLANLLFGEYSKFAKATQVLNSAISRLNQANYQAHWEAHEQGPRIMFKNCPYLKILPLHPELCRLDQLGLEIMTGLSFSQITKINLEDGTSLCTFITGV